MIDEDEKMYNMYAIAAEYENEQDSIDFCRGVKKQCVLLGMLDLAAARLLNIEDKEKHLQRAMKEYARLYYDNLNAKMVRDYALIYDKKNINQYPVEKPLPSLNRFIKETNRYVNMMSGFYTRYVHGK